jgi:hypothetical protein
MTIFRKGKDGKSHTEWEPFDTGGQDGTAENPLSEPVPNYFFRPDDYWVEGGNNTLIIFGRDRTGRGEVDSANIDKGESKKNSLGKGSYGNYMGAGAIDIVVGRGAPFPMQVRNFSLGPLYQTKYDIVELKGENLRISEGTGVVEPITVPHPGYAMDASRILISQMTRVDKNFNIESNIRKNGLPPSKNADQVRVHAREEVRIVTGGAGEKRNSQGEAIMKKGGIHLMAQNQKQKQQPIPLGDNLLECLSEMMDQITKSYTEVIRLTKDQMEFNRILGRHTHRSPFYGIPTAFDPELAAQSAIIVKSAMQNVIDQAAKEKNNVTSLRAKYLTQGDKSGEDNKFINSVFNTTN